MNIIEAVKEAMAGKKIRRKEWFFISKDKCLYVTGVPNLTNEISHLCTFGTPHHDHQTATFLFTDVLANDWEVIE